MRIVESQVGEIRRKVFTEVARMAFEGGDYSRIEELPYRIVPGEVAKYRESIFLERAIVGERLRLAIGLPLRPVDEHAPLSMNIDASAIAEKYYDPPLVNIIKFACNACPEKYFVSNGCQGCLAHPCIEACPVDAIAIGENRKSLIDQDRCIKCGRCRSVCPYSAILKLERPCAEACGVDAIGSDENGKAAIDYSKCVSCGMCIVNCPFGAISDKGQIFQLIHAIKGSAPVIAILAPAFVGQFGPKVTYGKLVTALKELGIKDVFEVAVGADLCSIEEAKDFLEEVPDKQAFMGTSCCPAWSVMAKTEYPEMAHCISMALTPMVLTARLQKRKCPECKIVFIGPCSAKKLEASRRSVRSNVDFVLTFEEIMGLFEAKGINPEQMAEEPAVSEATAAGKGFAVSGGVAKAVAEVIERLAPEREIRIASAEGLRECKKMLNLAKAGKYDGYLLEGMACPGGCAAGAGTLQPPRKTATLVAREQTQSKMANALDTPHKSSLHMIKE
ncbi:MAG: 4Fe-4S dicluster domain-containing protein [Clostridiales bacterium]